ncbi:MAG: B-box zinc finger protein [Actinobacteria bacterium]|nr:B-box zinc finger protein [Actinomycetota bacterium]
MKCVNHPSVEANVRCSNCGDPICPDCMIFAPVGVKCPKCGKLPKSALVTVKPERVLLSVILGLVSAVVGGYIFGLVLMAIGFLAFIVAFVLGMGIGEAISWASGRHHGRNLAVWAAACAALAVFFGIWGRATGFTASAPGLRYALTAYSFWGFIWMAVAAYGSWQRNA